MNRKRTSTDGFILRRRQPQQTAGSERRQLGIDNLQVPSQFLDEKKSRSNPTALNKHNNKTTGIGINRRDIDDSLKDIDLNEPKKKKKRHFKPSKKAVKRTFIALFIILALIGGYLGIKALIASGRLFGGNFLDLFGQGQPLKTDQFGRSNILIFGTSEDDEGHDGASLTDSIIVASVDQKKNDAFMFSVPRDLYVDYGEACNSGYEGKINEVYACARGNSTDDVSERRGQQALQDMVGEVYGMDVQYAVKVNYKVVRESVDAIGGVDVTINSRDPRGVLDRNFDWRCNYQCYKVKYSNGKHHLNGEQALFLAQARGESAPTYGFEESNFDRERNQRKIMTAMLKKANSSSTLSNPVKVSNLIDALGDNVRTNFVAGEIKTLARLSKDIKANTIQNLDFFKEGEALFTTGNIGGMSVVMPAAGTFNYDDIHAFIRSYQISDEVTKEKASIEVLNGSGVPGAAQETADRLEDNGLIISNIGNAPAGQYGKVAAYTANGNKPATKKKLKKLLKVSKVKSLPSNIQSSANFVVVVGQ